MEKAEGVGYGKVILFGEHFVVYGLPAIATGIPSLRTVVEVKPGKLEGFDSRITEAFRKVQEALGINGEFSVKVKESVPIGKNLGSSAAILTAFAKALRKLKGLEISDEELNKAVYEGEKVMHGTPSGIDNTSSVFGKPIVFRKTPSGPEIKPLEKNGTFHLLLVDVGPPIMTTKEAVEHFRKIKESTKASEDIFSAYQKIFEEAKEALKEGNAEKLGLIANINHGLLSSFGVSSMKIEEARYLLLSQGALGAKLTGAGTGGNIIAFFKNEEEQKGAEKFMKSLGYECFPLTF